ncbi:hypothetical protein GYMLUDRAFT_249253 [Collybiopsis luxurians FD-317 M1]|uniref:Uncharacterized protein n=1 Tax=Collybiopsis luxurians FD-317 M1 TaxID=944289 RepID=A0A0D0AVY3_9AGAR|nr:hypothetical protein GYMLUDRAFT_249253 [Collybiopsis luxurians FD-317 M1]
MSRYAFETWYHSGLFLVLCGISIHIFRRKYAPGKLYIIATPLFFALSTASVVLDVFFRLSALGIIGPKLLPTQSSFGQPGIDRVLLAIDYVYFATGALGDVILIHRCYRLWSSRKRAIILPITGLLGVVAVWLFFMLRAGNQNVAIALTDVLYSIVALAENLLLTGMIAGRLWWLNRRIRKILPSAEFGHSSRRQSLVGIILESAVLVPGTLILVIVAAFSKDEDFELIMLNPCVLTQVISISSILITIRVGITVDEPETSTNTLQSYSTTPDLESPKLSVTGTELTFEDQIAAEGRRSDQTLQPFRLKYEQYSQQQYPDSPSPSLGEITPSVSPSSSWGYRKGLGLGRTATENFGATELTHDSGAERFRLPSYHE